MSRRNRTREPFDGQSSDVDWDRALEVNSRAQDGGGHMFTLLGDPIKWGAEETMRIGSGVASDVFSNQLVRTQVIDAYPRNWACMGNVIAPQEYWDLAAGDWDLGLELTMGVGQAAIIQTVDLRALIDYCATWYHDRTDTQGVAKSWFMSGGLLGRAISIRVASATNAGEGTPPAANIRVSALVSPFAAGTGI